MNAPRVSAYEAWLEADIRARDARYPLNASAIRFSILTTVYEKTDAALFLETANCLNSQTLPFTEWIVLAHGPISPELELLLGRLAADTRFKLLSRAENLGIMGGMRVCLEAASGDYLVPMDADDLLTSDALQILSAVAQQNHMPAMLYSDEDLLVAGVATTPYWRPDWDPVLNLASSYIWHACAIKRQIAIEIDIYSDPKANWCHDWDTTFRIEGAGHQIVHVPEILYHWRQHPASSTNRALPESGSRVSQRYLLERRVAASPNPDCYEIRDFSIFRGADEWYVYRRESSPPAVAAVSVGQTHILDAFPASTRKTCALNSPNRQSLSWWHRLGFRRPEAADEHITVADLSRSVEDLSERWVVVISDRVVPHGSAWWWEAIKLLELHRDLALIGGLITDRHDRVLRGAEVFSSTGELVSPQRGRPASDPGPFAIALKPHCVASAPTDLFVAEVGLLRDVLKTMSPGSSLAGLGVRLGIQAHLRKRRVAYSPLIKAAAHGTLLDDEAQELSAGWAEVSEAARSAGLYGKRIGSLGFLEDRSR